MKNLIAALIVSSQDSKEFSSRYQGIIIAVIGFVGTLVNVPILDDQAQVLVAQITAFLGIGRFLYGLFLWATDKYDKKVLGGVRR